MLGKAMAAIALGLALGTGAAAAQDVGERVAGRDPGGAAARSSRGGPGEARRGHGSVHHSRQGRRASCCSTTSTSTASR